MRAKEPCNRETNYPLLFQNNGISEPEYLIFRAGMYDKKSLTSWSVLCLLNRIALN